MFLLLCALSLAPTAPVPTAPIARISEDAPAVFADMTFEDGRAAASAQGKILVLDAMTSWCGPCKQMDSTTWIDPGLEAWMAENTIAIQLDMDLHVDLKNELKITAFPTIIAFDKDGEFDRIVGYRDAAAMGDWLKLVRAGNTELERIQGQVAAYPWTQSTDDLKLRIHFANELYYVAGYADALRLALEVWEAAPAAGFNRSALRWILGDLSRLDSASHQAVSALRETLTKSVSPSTMSADSGELKDWIDLSLALQDHVGLESWILGRNARGEFATVQQFGKLLYSSMLREQHWRAAGLALVDPISQFEASGEKLSYFDAMDSPPTAKGAAMGMTLATPIADTPKAAKVGAVPSPGKAKATGASASTEDDTADAPKGGAVPMVPMAAAGNGKAPTKAVPMMPMIGAGASASSDSESTSSKIRSQFRWDASNAYAVLLAAGRNDEATVLGETVLRYEDSAKARIAMVCRALETGQGNGRMQVHVRWLDEAMSTPTKDM